MLRKMGRAEGLTKSMRKIRVLGTRENPFEQQRTNAIEEGLQRKI